MSQNVVDAVGGKGGGRRRASSRGRFVAQKDRARRKLINLKSKKNMRETRNGDERYY